jgi:uncharacterized repeat protein (TIGR03833 family)
MGNYNLVPKRSEIKLGSKVKLIQKVHYESGEITEGTVAQILTSAVAHPRGIKVRLTNGIVGRVQALGDQPILPVEEPGYVEPNKPLVPYIPEEDELL